LSSDNIEKNDILILVIDLNNHNTD